MLRDKSSLIDIINACDSLGIYIKDKTLDQFRSNEMLQDAVIRKIEIIGEASNRVSDDLKNRFPNLPWDKMKGMRNILIHMYDELDLEIVWDTVNRDIPSLKILLQKILSSISD
jgi:uncharacterized protein with HEPN domain